MYLTKEEEKMLDGEFGSGVANSMKILTKLGDAYGAEKMIDCCGAHFGAWKSVPEVGIAVLNEFSKLSKETEARIPCTTNPLILNLSLSKRFGVPEDVAEEYREYMSKWENLVYGMGASPTYSCHWYPFEPKMGDHYALTESNVNMFANTWYGIRSNMEGDISAVASAVTGKTPEYGLHLTENRYAKVLVELSNIDTKKLTHADVSAISYYAGKQAHTYEIIAYKGFPRSTDASQVKCMQPQINGSSSSLSHVIGITPEAKTLEMAFGGENPEDKIIIGKEEMNETFDKFNTTSEEKVDAVFIGCPHCTLKEIKELALLLRNKKVKEDVRLWIGTSAVVKSLADKMGLVSPIESAGGIILTDMCTLCPFLIGLIKRWNMKTVATNSGCFSGIIAELPTFMPVGLRFGSVKKCMEAAVNGKWQE